MTKAELLRLIEGAPDDAVIVLRSDGQAGDFGCTAIEVRTDVCAEIDGEYRDVDLALVLSSE